MDGRFRIRPASGPEFQVDSLEEFEERVKSGELGPDDEVFDALTGEWTPATSHPVYRLVTDPLVTGEEDLDFDLVQHEGPSPEEEARAFLEKMEEERRSDPDRTILHGTGHHDWSVPEEESGREEEASTPTPERETVSEADVSSRSRPARAEAAPPAAPSARPSAPAEERRPAWNPLTVLPAGATAGRSARQWLMGAAALAGVALVLVGTTSVALPALRNATDGPPQGALAVGEEEAPRVEPPSEAILRQQARSDFLAEVDAIRRERRLGVPPESWLGGAYLANASDYPEVREYWSRYLGFVDAVRASEDQLYRDAYLEALDRTRTRGAVRTLRLASGLSTFQDGRPEREAVYARVSGLAQAALELHRFLEENEADITYQPARGERLSEDPVIEATAADAELQAELDAAIDRVLAALHGPEGLATPAEPEDIPQRLVELLEGVVAPSEASD